MGSLKSLAQGFLVATGLVWIFNIVALVRGGDAWLGLAYLLVLLIPATSILYLKLKNLSNTVTPDGVAKWRTVLFAFQGVALAFWSYDLLTTFYAIDITGLAIELNPLGWPLGILGAFAFYGPSLLFSYVLLFRLKENISFYAAIPLTMISMSMSLMNLFAGAQNFQVFVHTATLAANVRFELLAVTAALNLVIPIVLTRRMMHPKPQLSIKTA
ncbi:MAG: hypothetical protein M1540_06710 [Candidatus Bathyarchaeota archaeon]|nr:hypothetical protein [Candidatus Bathyarchaeota archaeon]